MVAARNISFGQTCSYEDSQTLKQATQRDCEISTPGDIQSMTGQGFEQFHLRYSCFKWRVNPMTCGNPFQKKSHVYDLPTPEITKRTLVPPFREPGMQVFVACWPLSQH